MWDNHTGNYFEKEEGNILTLEYNVCAGNYWHKWGDRNWIKKYKEGTFKNKISKTSKRRPLRLLGFIQFKKFENKIILKNVLKTEATCLLKEQQLEQHQARMPQGVPCPDFRWHNHCNNMVSIQIFPQCFCPKVNKTFLLLAILCQ